VNADGAQDAVHIIGKEASQFRGANIAAKIINCLLNVSELSALTQHLFIFELI
jgi:hypothetical protein